MSASDPKRTLRRDVQNAMTDEGEQRCEEKLDAWLSRTLRRKVKSRPLGLPHQHFIPLSHFSMNSDRVWLRRTACHGTLDGGAFTEIFGVVPRHTPPPKLRLAT